MEHYPKKLSRKPAFRANCNQFKFLAADQRSHSTTPRKIQIAEQPFHQECPDPSPISPMNVVERLGSIRADVQSALDRLKTAQHYTLGAPMEEEWSSDEEEENCLFDSKGHPLTIHLWWFSVRCWVKAALPLPSDSKDMEIPEVMVRRLLEVTDKEVAMVFAEEDIKKLAQRQTIGSPKFKNMSDSQKLNILQSFTEVMMKDKKLLQQSTIGEAGPCVAASSDPHLKQVTFSKSSNV